MSLTERIRARQAAPVASDRCSPAAIVPLPAQPPAPMPRWLELRRERMAKYGRIADKDMTGDVL